MEESKGRRIKRSLLIKPSSVKFLENDDIEKLKRVNLISEYIDSRVTEINEYNKKNSIDKSLLLNGRNLTNIGVFRIYIEEYLKAHPMTNENLTLMCRQLEPTSQGIPIQIYTFSKDKEWTKYEGLTSDIFDHLLSSCLLYTSPSPRDRG